MIDQTFGQEPEENRDEEAEQPTQEESPLSEETFPKRQPPREPLPAPTDCPASPDAVRAMEWLTGAAQAVRAAADQSAAPEVDHALIDRYVAGQLDEHARRYVVRMTLQHANWDQAYGEALRRTIAESN